MGVPLKPRVRREPCKSTCAQRQHSLRAQFASQHQSQPVAAAAGAGEPGLGPGRAQQAALVACCRTPRSPCPTTRFVLASSRPATMPISLLRQRCGKALVGATTLACAVAWSWSVASGRSMLDPASLPASAHRH